MMADSVQTQGRRRVCFLYIAQAHQLLHTLSVAVELANGWPMLDVELVAVTPQHLDYASTLLKALDPAPLGLKLLGPGWLRRWRGQGSSTPHKLPMLAANALRLNRYDAIVTPERTTAVLRQFGFSHPRYIYTQHGAGDRAGPFEPRLGAFDLVFAAGGKQWDRMVGQGLVAADRCAVVGYPKFDLVDDLHAAAPNLFANSRPSVIYNPHFDPELSSWPRWGREVLAAFAAQDRYNLIFAPHVRLFDGASPADIPALRRFLDNPSIHMDLGGPAAFDMTYTQMADIYLGDVSSQIYEFIRTPKPCLFLNAHGAAWRGDESYRHWRYGPVLDTAERLIGEVDAACANHSDFAPEQLESFRYSFDLEGRSSRRAAEAIAQLVLGKTQ